MDQPVDRRAAFAARSSDELKSAVDSCRSQKLNFSKGRSGVRCIECSGLSELVYSWVFLAGMCFDICATSLFFHVFRNEQVSTTTDAAIQQKYPRLTLHLYDHCPYCVRVQLALGWKGIPYEMKLYGYGANNFLKSAMRCCANAAVC